MKNTGLTKFLFFLIAGELLFILGVICAHFIEAAYLGQISGYFWLFFIGAFALVATVVIYFIASAIANRKKD